MKKLHLLIAIGLAVPALAVPTMAMAQTPSTTAAGKPGTNDNASAVPAADLAFIRDAAESGKAEVQASQIAMSKSTDQGVKEFARQMVTDHSQANTKLEQLARSKGVTLPVEPGAADKKTLQTLADANGAKFDQHYMDEYGLKAHRAAVEKFRKQAQSGQDADVKAFAQETLPTLEKHLQHATSMPKPGGAR